MSEQEKREDVVAENDNIHEEAEIQEIKADGEEESQEGLDEVVRDISEKESSEEEEDFKQKFFYLAAEMDNMKKRFDREKNNLIKYGNEKVLSGLLEVVDNFERTTEAISKDEDEKIKNIYNGVEMVRKQFLAVLEDNGLERVDSLGETFDPNVHEAMAQQPADGKKDQEIIQVYQHGYKLNGRLLRAAKVVIANNN